MMISTQIKETTYLGMDSVTKVGLEKVLSVVCDVLNVYAEDVKGKSRKSKISEARHFFCYLAYISHRSKTLMEIGKFIGRDHATVLHSKNKISDLIDVYEHELRLVVQMKKRFGIITSVDVDSEDINKAHVGWYKTPRQNDELRRYCERFDVVTKMKL